MSPAPEPQSAEPDEPRTPAGSGGSGPADGEARAGRLGWEAEEGEPAILVDEEWFQDVLDRLEAAEDRIRLQAMTFEGDETGWAVAHRLVDAARRGVDVTAVVDAFTDHYVSDTPADDPAVADEVASTREMMARMEEAGVDVVRTRPFGPLGVFVLARNHKKAVVVDDRVYLGGVNFSDHNRSWHDFLLRLDDPGLADQVAGVVEETTQGREPHRAYPSGLVTNHRVWEAFRALLEGVGDQVVVSSPYLADTHMCRRLEAAADRGVDVEVLTLDENNLAVFNRVSPYVHERLRRAGADVRYYETFSHAKFLLADRERALVGSSNFGLDSLCCKDEIGLVVDDPATVARLDDRLRRQADLRPYRGRPSRTRYALAGVAAHAVEAFLRAYGSLVTSFSHVLRR
jgi:cardiolipin synthase